VDGVAVSRQRNASLKILHEHGNSVVLDPRTPDELAKLGIALPSLPQARPGKGDIIVAVLVTEPLLMPDNACGPCADCAAPLQYRPYHRGTEAAILCSPCALRRLESAS
jgi:hypothetical protein